MTLGRVLKASFHNFMTKLIHFFATLLRHVNITVTNESLHHSYLSIIKTLEFFKHTSRANAYVKIMKTMKTKINHALSQCNLKRFTVSHLNCRFNYNITLRKYENRLQRSAALEIAKVYTHTHTPLNN